LAGSLLPVILLHLQEPAKAQLICKPPYLKWQKNLPLSIPFLRRCGKKYLPGVKNFKLTVTLALFRASYIQNSDCFI